MLKQLMRQARQHRKLLRSHLRPDSAKSEQPKEVDYTAELVRCSNGLAGFVHFCLHYVFVEDKETHQEVRFDLWACQREIVQMLFAGDWLWILKARQLGVTTLIVAYTLWLVTFHTNRTAVVLNQDKEYAKDFLDRIRYTQDRLPEWMQVSRVNAKGKSADNKTSIEFNRDGHGCRIRSVACTLRAIRSLSADLIIFDEAAYQKYLKNARKAAQPAVERSRGQIIGMSTSEGPRGEFYDVWADAVAGKNRYKPIFLKWDAHPSRDAAWYAKEAKENEADPLYMFREYPASPEEAFQSAQGRIYPMFTNFGANGEKFVRKLDVRPEWRRYRGIDFGGVDPFVCLWAAMVPGDGAGLTVDPECPNLIRELLAYSRTDAGDPADEDNHACDAARYLVISPGLNGLTGHVHFYRELYVPNSAAKGLTVPDLARRIADWSGSEQFEHTAADRSRPDSITLLNQLGVRATAHRQLQTSGQRRAGEIEQGIIRVNALITATHRGDSTSAIPEMRFAQLPKGFKPGGAPQKKALFS